MHKFWSIPQMSGFCSIHNGTKIIWCSETCPDMKRLTLSIGRWALKENVPSTGWSQVSRPHICRGTRPHLQGNSALKLNMIQQFHTESHTRIKCLILKCVLKSKSNLKPWQKWVASHYRFVNAKIACDSIAATQNAKDFERLSCQQYCQKPTWRLSTLPPPVPRFWLTNLHENGSHLKIVKKMSQSCQKLIKNFLRSDGHG